MRGHWTGRRRVGLALLLIVVGVIGAAVYRAQAFARRELPAYLETRLSEALGRPVTIRKVSFWPIGAFSIRDFRVLPGPGETEPPLTAERLRAYVSWPALLQGRLQVTALHVDGAHARGVVDLRDVEKDGLDPAAQLRGLYRIGVRQIGLHRAQADLTAILPNGERQPVTARSLEFIANLQPETFRYRLSTRSWSGGPLTAQNLFIRGAGDEDSIRIEESRARVQGGQLAARGTYVAEDGDIAMQVRVRELPMASLRPQLGIPAEWDVSGRLSGTMDVSATTGAVRRVQGTMEISPGAIARARARLPWRTAKAQLDYRPERITLQGIDIRGEGIRLQGQGAIGGPESLPLPQRPFTARGTVEASNTDTVISLARVLAFDPPVRGRWEIGQAAVSFQASGIVGNLDDAVASGRFQARDFVVRPRPEGEALVIRTIEGDLDRRGNRLVARNIRATAEGLSAAGELAIRPSEPGRPGAYAASGQIDLTNLVVLREQVPDMPLWQYVRPAGPGSRGRVSFRAGGPTEAPEKVQATGSFRFSGFGADVPTGTRSERWQFPVREMTGKLSLRGNRLAISDVSLRSDQFRAGADLNVSQATSAGGTVTGSIRLISDQWASLPPLRGRVPEGISGGTLIVEAQVPPGWTGQTSLEGKPLEGTITLNGATVVAAVQGQQRRIPLQSATARFRMARNQLTVHSYQAVTPYFRTSGTAQGDRVAGRGDWNLRGQGALASGNAGNLAQWWTGESQLRGGNLSANYTFNLPAGDSDRLRATARIRVTDAVPVLPEGTLPFPAEEARIRSLTGTLTVSGRQVAFQDLDLQAAGFRLAGDGSLRDGVFDGTVTLTTREWRRLAGEIVRALPVTGGELTFRGQVRGRLEQLSRVPIQGVLTLRNARLQNDRNASVPVQGGNVDLTSNVRGTLSNLVTADLNGSFTVRNLYLRPVRPDRKPTPVYTANGRFDRRGTRVRLTDLDATMPGARLTGEGDLLGVGTGNASHNFQFRAEGPSLSAILPAVAIVPGKTAGGRFTGYLAIAGTAADPAAQAEGRAEVVGGSWTPPKHTLPFKLDQAHAHFVKRGSTATLDNVELRVNGGQANLSGTVQGLGSKHGPRHNVRLTWTLEDASAWASRFLPVPGWFVGGAFTGEAHITGTSANPAATASGRFAVRDAGFMPPQPFLGGPLRPINVTSAGGTFTRAGGRTRLDDLRMVTAVGTATGTVVATDAGNADIQARAQIQRLQALVDLWPGFKDRLRGGSGEMVLSLRGPLANPRRLAGTVNITGRNGVLTVENVRDIYQEQPFDTFTTAIRRGADGTVKLENVTMRGPKANLDGAAVITPAGRVQGNGKAWFTEGFTRKLIKPGFLRPVAKFVGFKRLKSDFKVEGTLQRATLDMGITDTLLWKTVVRKQVPEHLRKIATGDVPIWSPGPFPTPQGYPVPPRTVSTR